MNKLLLSVLIWLVIAAFFYAAIWTNVNNTVSDCWLLTGLTAIGQILLTGMTYALS
jgi:hypothetical protein